MTWKDIAEIVYYIFGTVGVLGTLGAAAFAAYVYYRNSQLDRAKWALSLYEKFYEGTNLKSTRDRLDCEADSPDVQKIVREEGFEFTGYEGLALLLQSRQGRKQISD